MELPRARSLPRALSRTDAAKLVRSAWVECRTTRGVHWQVAAAVLLLLSVGLRVGELIALRPADYDSADGSLHVSGKGRRDRHVFIVDRELRTVLSSLALQEAKHLFFAESESRSTQTFRHRLRGFARSAGLTRHTTPHMLRHTAATLLLEDGVDLLFLQRLLGHENISTTAIYAHVGDASLRRALERAGLLSSLAA